MGRFPQLNCGNFDEAPICQFSNNNNRVFFLFCIRFVELVELGEFN